MRPELQELRQVQRRKNVKTLRDQSEVEKEYMPYHYFSICCWHSYFLKMKTEAGRKS